MAIPSRTSVSADNKPAAHTSGDALQILSSLLSSHRSHLLSLYTALGHSNPESHVSTKITALHSSLIATVQGQAKEAEDEVEGLKNEAKEVADRIVVARRRIGTFDKDLEDGLEDGRDENLLRRLARLKALEEGLEGTIAKRKDQLEALEQRLREFVPVMGEEAVEKAAKREEGEAEDDLGLPRIQRLEAQCVAFDAELTQRNQALVSHLQEIFNLWADLGITPTVGPASASSSAPASADSAEFDEHVLLHLGIDGTAIQSTGEAVPAGRREPQELLPTDGNLERARKRREWLETERAGREERIQVLYDDICPLWNRLGVPESEQEEFIESWKGLSEACISGYEAELERMQAARAEHMCLFVAKEREQIEALWNQMYVGDEERAALSIVQSEDYTEELLLAHEQERKRLEEELVDREPLLDLLGRYFGLIQEAHELEVAEKDPNRYAKGKRGVPGQLLREEKIRKRVAKEKPKLEQDLQTVIPEWENERGKAFLVNGSRFLEDLVARLEQEAAGKENKRARPGAPGSVGPIKRQQTGGASGPGPSRPGSPTKRPRTATVSRVATQRTGGPTTVASHRTGPVTAQKTGGGGPAGTASRIPTQMTGGGASVMRGGPSMLLPQATGTSTYYNPVTPTPNYGGGPGAMLAPATTLPRTTAMGIPSGWVQRTATATDGTTRPTQHDRLFSPVGVSGDVSVSTAARSMSFRPRPSVAQGGNGSRSVSGSTAVSTFSFASGRSGSSFATSVASK